MQKLQLGDMAMLNASLEQEGQICDRLQTAVNTVVKEYNDRLTEMFKTSLDKSGTPGYVKVRGNDAYLVAVVHEIRRVAIGISYVRLKYKEPKISGDEVAVVMIVKVIHEQLSSYEQDVVPFFQISCECTDRGSIVCAKQRIEDSSKATELLRAMVSEFHKKELPYFISYASRKT